MRMDFWIWNHEGVGVWQIGGDAYELGRRGTRVGRRVLYGILEVQRGDHGWGVGSALGGAGEITSVMM